MEIIDVFFRLVLFFSNIRLWGMGLHHLGGVAIGLVGI